MDLHLVLRGALSASLYAQLREAVLDGRLRAGDKLPASRELATQLGVARVTVARAYERLSAEGYLVGRVGDGTYVCYERPERARRLPLATPLRPRPAWRTAAARPAPEAVQYDFQVGVPDLKLFPLETWRRLLNRQLRRGSRPADMRGAQPLRAAIAHYAGLTRSVRAGEDNVVVTNGVQQALDLVVRTLLEPGDVVAVEDPCYPPARRLLEASGARVVPVRVDGEGLAVRDLPAAARLVYVTPSHQYPLGTAMSLARRAALLHWAERTGAAIVEDDYDSELRYDARPLEPLQSLDRAGRVIYAGTFSKVLSPGLRLGYLVAAASLVPTLCAARAVADGGGPLEPQLALAEMIEDGLLTRHARKVLHLYAERRNALLEALARHAAAELAPLPSFAGLHVCALTRRSGLDVADVVRRARQKGVHVHSLRTYCLATPRDGLVLGYGAIPSAKIDEGIRRLVAALRAAGSNGGGKR